MKKNETTHQGEQKSKNRMDTKYDYIFRITLLGDFGVGKTTLFHRVFGGNADSDTSLAHNFRMFIMRISKIKLKVYVSDTAQQEKFNNPKLLSKQLNNVDAVILVYDITNYQSFLHLEQLWLPLIFKNAKKNVNLLFIGTKADLRSTSTTTTSASSSPRYVMINEVIELAERYGYRSYISYSHSSYLIDGISNGNAMVAESSLLKDGREMFDDVFIPFTYQLTCNAAHRSYISNGMLQCLDIHNRHCRSQVMNYIYILIIISIIICFIYVLVLRM